MTMPAPELKQLADNLAAMSENMLAAAGSPWRLLRNRRLARRNEQLSRRNEQILAALAARRDEDACLPGGAMRWHP